MYFTSDLHFGHVNIIGYTGRPYVGLDEMREMLIVNWNNKVSASDTVIIVGDFAMGRIEDTLPVANRLNGDKILVMGNHDRPWIGSPQKQKDKWTDEYAKYFKLVDGPIYISMGGIEFMVNHFPYKSIERHGDRYDDYAPKNEGKWLIHGHTHLPEKISVERKEIHIGIDAWDYAPVHEDEILALIN